MKQFTVRLSHLVAGKHNPRRVKPAREAHNRLVALIKAHGLLHPLVVRPCEGKPNRFTVIAGNRRFAALNEIHHNDGDPQIPCVLRKVDQSTADALSLGENFGREPMHPLDEAEAFAKLASHEGKDAQAIAAEFGVAEHYVRQRMKLALLAKAVKEAFRDDQIDTGTAEAFCAVPEEKQLAVWKEVNGQPQHAQHVRNIIASGWIDSKLALFDLSVLPASAISQDLFSETVLVERQAFMDAQAQALVTRQEAMKDQGWSEVIIGRRQDLMDRLLSTDPLRPEFDPATTKKLAKIEFDRAKLEKAASAVDEHDDRRMQRLEERFDSLETRRNQIEQSSPVSFSEKTMAKGIAFLMLDPDGRAQTEYRVPRRRSQSSSNNGESAGGDGSSSSTEPDVATSDDLSDRQLAVTFTHQVLLVREALLKNDHSRRCILAMIMHEKIRSEALCIRRDANAATLHVSNGEGFKSPAFDRMTERAAKLDPFVKQPHVDDRAAYRQLQKLSASRLDALIDLLIVQCLTTHLNRRTELVELLAEELKIDVRDEWRPDANWLGAYQKPQLRHLITELNGAVHEPAQARKKSELVDQLSKLFTEAADGKLDDSKLAAKITDWLPSNLRPQAREN